MGDIPEVVLMVLGDTGSGKSSFLNRFLEDREGKSFKVSDSPLPVTDKASSESKLVNGVKRTAIDTEGLADGQGITATQIQNLALFLRKWEKGVHGVVIVVNGQNPRFGQTVKDVIKFAYDAFGTEDFLKYVCLVFTKCFAKMPDEPNRNTLRGKYGPEVEKYLKEISGHQANFTVPVYTVDCKDYEGEETKANIFQLVGWALSKKTPLSTSDFKEATVGYTEEEEFQNKVLKETSDKWENDKRYKVYVKQKRMKRIDNRGGDPRYSNWEDVPGSENRKAYEEREKEKEEVYTVNREMEHEGKKCAHTRRHWRWKIRNLETGQVTYSDYVDVSGSDEYIPLVDTTEDTQHQFEKDYEQNGEIRKVRTLTQIRRVKRNKNGEIIDILSDWKTLEKGEWKNVPEKGERKTEERERRGHCNQEAVTTKSEGSGVIGKLVEKFTGIKIGSKTTTTVRSFEIVWKEQRQVITYQEGPPYYTQWEEVPNTRGKQYI